MYVSCETPGVCPDDRITGYREWETIIGRVAGAFQMDEDERDRLLKNKIARLVAALPFIAHCENPGRTALAHLGTFILSVRLKELAAAGPTDDSDIFKRLHLLNSFVGGDKKIVTKGMSLLALIMLEDYQRDRIMDREVGKYNPLLTCSWDYKTLKEELLEKINAAEDTALDEIMTVSDTKDGFWEI